MQITIKESLAEFLEMIQNTGNFHMYSDQHMEFSHIALKHPLVEQMAAMDPFSPEYKQLALEVYLSIANTNREGYDAQNDERSDLANKDIYNGIPPWSEGPNAMQQVFFGIGHICHSLELSDLKSKSIVEYGSGSGEVILSLARMGCDAFAVDIENSFLEIIQKKAQVMGLHVEVENKDFTKAFPDKKFDRIIFCECFHHCLDFLDLIQILRKKLNPGGFVIFTQEPITAKDNDPFIPYPWGPRLDGVTISAIHHSRWMELGFTQKFFFEMMNRLGWHLEFHEFVVSNICICNSYIARPMDSWIEEQDYNINLGNHHTGILLRPDEWMGSDSKGRWTIKPTVELPVFRALGEQYPVTIDLTVNNHFPFPKPLQLTCGKQLRTFTVFPGQERVISLEHCTGQQLRIECDLHVPAEYIPNSTDHNQLGLYFTAYRCQKSK